MSDVQNRISSLRQLLEKENLFAWVSITSDPHASEYLPPHWADREWLSGFTGSAGTLIVTQHDALLWTDSRYWTQASGQLEGSGITLMKDGAPGVEGWDQWPFAQRQNRGPADRASYPQRHLAPRGSGSSVPDLE